jgi:cytoskeletal protein RodZ
MSYILDALKKSEQERGHGNVPDVQTVHSSSLNYRDDKKAYWPYILIVAVLLNLVAIGYFIMNQAGPAKTTQSVAESTDATRTAASTANTVKQEQPAIPVPAADETSQPGTGEASPVSTTTTAGDSETAVAQEKEAVIEEAAAVSERFTKKPEAQVATADSSEAIIDFYELPESIKQQIPTIIISAHVYSSNPMQRSIVINNNFMEEGEYVLDDLVLHEITRDGAVFDYRGTLFNYGVVSGWQ